MQRTFAYVVFALYEYYLCDNCGHFQLQTEMTAVQFKVVIA